LDSDTPKPSRMFINPFTLWTDLAFKTGLAMWASMQAATLRANRAAVAVIPTADAPAPKALEAAKSAEEKLASAHAEALRNAKVAVLHAVDAPRKARAAVRQPSKAIRFKPARAKLRSTSHAKRPNAKRRAKR